MSNRRHVVILGAGVTGLTSAVFLAEAGYHCTVIAAHVPGDQSIEYTSPWAGAHWRTAAKPEEPMLCDWAIQTYDYWLEMIRRENSDVSLPVSGLKMQDSYMFYNETPSVELWWSPHVEGFRQVSTVLDPVRRINAKSPVGFPDIKWAHCSRAPSINTPHYLLFLQQKAESLGVKVIKAKLPIDSGLEKGLSVAESTAQASGRPAADCFLNATGLGALKLCGDEAMHPIRGQTVLVKGEAAACRTRVGDGRAYCIPRPGSNSTILGGTQEKGNWSEEIDPATTKRILEFNSYMVPELLTGPDGGFEVISVQCGLRPGREGGPRMERETVGGRKVVHAYGHGGYGYETSVGSARLVVQLVNESIGGSIDYARL